MTGYRIRIRGVVQGVGFRPTVWRVARGLSLKGFVLNDGEGVIVALWCNYELASRFVEVLKHEQPPLASISSVHLQFATLGSPPDDFFIAESDETVQINAGIPVDAAMCAECAEETLNPASRRYRYPFTNCTHCGPRLTIIKALPYDRPKTSMAAFPLCPQCEREYQNPADRRFHAQPVACPACGPTVWLCDAEGQEISPSKIGAIDAIQAAVHYIRQGKILAVKGLGGFHLVCDATNQDVVDTLRRRKQRPDKPFAVMMKDAEQVGLYCQPSPAALEMLQSVSSPVVIMPTRNVTASLNTEGCGVIATAVAPNLGELGIMLPATPMHLLLCHDVALPLVMTSANLSGNPQCTDNREALEDLKGIADIWVLHNRDIVTRADDSVFRQTDQGLQILRRARGIAPSPIELPPGFEGTSSILAMGGEVKNAFCLLTSHGAIVSQYIGDLERVRIWEDFQRMLSHYQALYRFTPDRVAIDSHPEYLASKFAKSVYDDQIITEIQHHHAHVAACMGDNQLPIDHENVLGVVFDGLGYGEDGTLWGGEFLLADYHTFKRIGHLETVALPGASKAIVQPWRNLIAWLQHSGIDATDKRAVFEALGIQPNVASTILSMIQTGLNSPNSSSVGRLFDAVSALLSVCIHEQSYEGQAAIELETLAATGASDVTDIYPFTIRDGLPARLDPAPMWQAIIRDVLSFQEPGFIAYKFHVSLAKAIGDMVAHLCQHFHVSSGLPKIVLSGGVFQNRLLLKMTVKILNQQGFNVLNHQQVPANDGGLAFGQALIAAAASLSGNKQSLKHH